MKAPVADGGLDDGWDPTTPRTDPTTSRTSGNGASGETPFKQMNSLNSWKTMTSVHAAITSEKFIESQKLSPGYWQETETKSCCGLFKRKAKPKPFSQTLVVLRHSERLDQMDPEGYKESEMGKLFPWDGPLTKAGNELAEKVAVELSALHKQVNFSAIACSPYLRCLETAAPVAKLLDLPIMLDQEIAEVWEEKMPSDRLPHRSPEQLTELAGKLGLQVVNPPLPGGGIKLFGKTPVKHPESLEAGHKRFLVRIESYIRLSANTRQNFIIVTHAPAVGAMLNIFERGYADVERADYCARVIARRKVLSDKEDDHGVYAAQWDVEAKAVEMTVSPPDANMHKTFENMHLEDCDENSKMVADRKERRTNTDEVFDAAIKAIAVVQREESRQTREPTTPKSATSGNEKAFV